MTHGVLIVDDDQFIRKLMATRIEDVAEFELHEPTDGVEALEVAQGERPSLVFLVSPLDLLRPVDQLDERRAH